MWHISCFMIKTLIEESNHADSGETMNIILFADIQEKKSSALARLIQNQFPGIHVDTVHSVNGLSKKIRRPFNGISVIVVFVVSEDTITGLSPLLPLFETIRLILVLPERADGLGALGLKLSPFFVGFRDSSLEDITAILTRLEQRSRNRYQGIQMAPD